jgi:hypothetical protein
MRQSTPLFVGLDVHKDSIVVAQAGAGAAPPVFVGENGSRQADIDPLLASPPGQGRHAPGRVRSARRFHASAAPPRRSIRNNGIPLLEGEVCDDHDRLLFIAPADNLEKEVRSVRVVAQLADLVDRERVGRR